MMRFGLIGIALLMSLATASEAENVNHNSAGHKATAAHAAQKLVMAPLLGNTLIYVNDIPAETRHEVYNTDHTWVIWFPQARPSWGNSYSAPHFRGTWEFHDDGMLCATYHRSNLHPHQTSCHAMTIHHVGDSWTDADHMTVTLLQGIQ